MGTTKVNSSRTFGQLRVWQNAERCGSIYQLRSIWRIAQYWSIALAIGLRLGLWCGLGLNLEIRVRVMLGLGQLAKCAARFIKRAARLVKRTDWPNTPYSNTALSHSCILHFRMRFRCFFISHFIRRIFSHFRKLHLPVGSHQGKIQKNRNFPDHDNLLRSLFYTMIINI